MRVPHGGANDSAGDDQFAEFDGRRRPEELEAPYIDLSGLCPVSSVSF